jgi:hypothetical protein
MPALGSEWELPTLFTEMYIFSAQDHYDRKRQHTFQGRPRKNRKQLITFCKPPPFPAHTDHVLMYKRGVLAFKFSAPKSFIKLERVIMLIERNIIIFIMNISLSPGLEVFTSRSPICKNPNIRLSRWNAFSHHVTIFQRGGSLWFNNIKHRSSAGGEVLTATWTCMYCFQQFTWPYNHFQDIFNSSQPS